MTKQYIARKVANSKPSGIRKFFDKVATMDDIVSAIIIQGLIRVHQYTVMAAPKVSQYAALEAVKVGEETVQKMVFQYDKRRRLIYTGLNELGLTTIKPQGAFYAFPNIETFGFDDETFAQRLLEEERVAVVPGSAFGRGGEGFVRCSYATSYDKIKEALQRMGRFMARHGQGLRQNP
ncbi:MAG TPA: aminotransferase class I/II-fold pyridoxal phosphate-dependent enzyme [Anaerolineae bacterium]|nr:aminotransferase class I/II-fold pyridoxal phosphate-dependent enzyme [Anaerolineae bacterium]